MTRAPTASIFKLTVFENKKKWSHFNFSILTFSIKFCRFKLSITNVNVARFARNVEWDFLCDFQTPCVEISQEDARGIAKICVYCAKALVMLTKIVISTAAAAGSITAAILTPLFSCSFYTLRSCLTLHSWCKRAHQKQCSLKPIRPYCHFKAIFLIHCTGWHNKFTIKKLGSRKSKNSKLALKGI